jgi:hypothetical protein
MYSKYSLMNIISNNNIKNGKVDKIDNTDSELSHNNNNNNNNTSAASSDVAATTTII